MAMKMDWMNIVTGIAHLQPVAPALFQVKRRRHIHHVESRAVDGPSVKPVNSPVLFGKEHVNYFVRLLHGTIILTKQAVVPFKRVGFYPLRLSSFVPFIFHYYPHAVSAVIIGQIAHYPGARICHFHNCRDTFCRAYPQYRHYRGIWYRVAIKGYYFKSMAGQGKAAYLSCAPVKNMK